MRQGAAKRIFCGEVKKDQNENKKEKKAKYGQSDDQRILGRKMFGKFKLAPIFGKREKQ